MNTKATLYLDAGVYRALKVKAALSDRTVSETANALLSQGMAEKPMEPAPPKGKVELRFEGKMGFPVLHGLEWPEGYVFDRSELYD